MSEDTGQDDTGQDQGPARRRDGNGFVLFLLVIAGISGLVGWGALRRASTPPDPLAIPEIIFDEDLDVDFAEADATDGVEPAPIASAGADVGVATTGEVTRDASVEYSRADDDDATQAQAEMSGEEKPAEQPSDADVQAASGPDSGDTTTEVVVSARPSTEAASGTDQDGGGLVAVLPREPAIVRPNIDTPEHEPADTPAGPEVPQHEDVVTEIPNTTDAPVTEAATAGETIVAAVPREPQVNGTQTDPAASTPPSTASGSPDLPTFDLVRIDVSGGGLVAGRAAPGTKVRVLVDGQEIGTAEAGAKGEFVAFVQTPARNEGQLLSLSVLGATGEVINSEEQILVLPTTNPVEETSDIAPAVLKAEPQGVRVIQPLGLAKVDNVTLDVITYDEEGQVLLSGRAPRAQTIRIYVDQSPVIDVDASAAGTWETRLPGVDEGRYVLRVDALNADGSVSSRVESPFQRVYPTAEHSKLGQITVQPGNTLWVLAQERYGSGFSYTQIFAANRDLIRDPDLIYPGQIFQLPEAGKSGQ